jgi:hypothetical protein
MPDLGSLGVGNVSKSVSMTDIMQTNINDSTSGWGGWGQHSFGKSLSSSAILKEVSIH